MPVYMVDGVLVVAKGRDDAAAAYERETKEPAVTVQLLPGDGRIIFSGEAPRRAPKKPRAKKKKRARPPRGASFAGRLGEGVAYARPAPAPAAEQERPTGVTHGTFTVKP